MIGSSLLGIQGNLTLQWAVASFVRYWLKSGVICTSNDTILLTSDIQRL